MNKKQTAVQRRTSMKAKVAGLMIAAILLCALIFSAIGVMRIGNICRESAAEVMNLRCQEETSALNEQLLVIEHSLGIIADYIKDHTPDDSEFDRDPDLMDTYIASVRDYFDSVASISTGVYAYYYRYMPEKYTTTGGFFVTDEDGDGIYTGLPLTDLTQYDRDDTGHVGWYYLPADAGEAMWLEPYLNENSGTQIISYEIPLMHANGTVFGVIGVDVNFGTITDRVLAISAYETGRACLVTADGRIECHESLANGTDIRSLGDSVAALADALEGESSGESLCDYTADGQRKAAAFSSLRNGLRFVLYAPQSEIFSEQTKAVTEFSTLAIIIALLGVLIAWLLARHMTRPLARLTDTARKIGGGTLDVTFPPAGNDEIGLLNETMQHMAHNLRQMVGGLSNKAYRDALTGVRNKGAYEEEIAKYSEGKEPFALVMFDVNYLKRVNDTYGHEMGDIYLKNACALICRVYQHSPVFRLGGDEFIAVLTGPQVDAGQSLLEEMAWQSAHINQSAENPWDRVDMAVGMAVYDPQRDAGMEDPTQEIFRQADAAMYKDKQGKRRT